MEKEPEIVEMEVIGSSVVVWSAVGLSHSPMKVLIDQTGARFVMWRILRGGGESVVRCVYLLL